MAYNRKPNYHFNDKTATGIDKVPNGRLIVVEDFDGEVKTFIKTANSGLTSASSISNALPNLRSTDASHKKVVSGSSIVLNAKETGFYQLTANQAASFTIEGFEDGILDEVIIEIVNGGSYTMTFPGAAKWMDPAGVFQSSLAGTGIALNGTGSDWIIFWSTDGGTNIHSKLMR